MKAPKINMSNMLKACGADNEKIIIINEKDTQKIQEVLLEILDDIVYVCEKYHIGYALCGGSALGAVRHNGFIPWDDDIDISMCRKDVERFIPLFKREYGDRYWIHVPGETKGYDSLIIRIMTKKIRARAFMDSNKTECGLCVDIFTVENTFNHKVPRVIHGLGCMAFRYILSCIRFERNKEEIKMLAGNNKEFMKHAKMRWRWGRVMGILPLTWWSRLASGWVQLCKNENSEFVVIASGQYQFFREMYKRKEFCATTEKIFEGRALRIPQSYDKYLTILYGNYMEIPKKEKREKHVMLELDREKLYSI